MARKKNCKRFKKDEFGWKKGEVFQTRVHTHREKFKLTVSDKGGGIFTKTFNDRKSANEAECSYLLTKKRKRY